MNLMLAGQILLLISIANSAPLFAKRFLFRDSAGWPLDCGIRLGDGQFVLGPTKTVGGLASSIVATGAAAYAIGLCLAAGLIVAFGAMAGDMISSFMKRRLQLQPSSRATGLDQIPEVVVPSLLATAVLPLTMGDIAAIVIAFFCGELILSQAFYRLGLRDQPY